MDNLIPGQDAQSHRILVVDDNEDSAESLAMLLQLHGNDVRVAFDGARAISTALEFQPEVILLDIGLPDMSGYEVARKMRQEPALQDVILVAQTGWGQDQDRQRAQEAGFHHHLVKPVDLDALRALLAQIGKDVSSRHSA